jgi:iron(III) transport system substrate-binding protein
VDAIVLKAKGLSAPYESPNAKNLPKLYSDPEHYWTGFPTHARIIIYNKNLFTDREEVPTSMFDMINPRFNGKACIANPLFGTTSMHAAALFQVLGRDMAEAFFNSLKANKVTIVSSNNEVGIRVAAGDFAFGIADTDDYSAAFRQGKPVGVVFPDQEAFGTLVIPNALILMRDGRNPEQGKRFVDFLFQPEVQELLAAGEVSPPPIHTETPMPEGIPSLYNVKAMQIDYGKLISQSKELSRGFLKEWVDSQK